MSTIELGVIGKSARELYLSAAYVEARKRRFVWNFPDSVIADMKSEYARMRKNKPPTPERE